MLPDFSYVRPQTTDEVLRNLASPDARIHAGGTDLLGCLRDGVFKARKVVSISGLEELHGIRQTQDGGARIGALTTLSEIVENSDIRRRYPGLAQAAAEVASPQLRNQGTLGGNLCQRPRCWYFRGEFHCAKKGGGQCFAVDGENRYHAIFGGDPCFIVHPSDTAPMLLALGAAVRIEGSRGSRVVPLESFFVLPEEDLHRETILADDEVLTEVLLPAPAPDLHSSYRKARERGAWDFALASVALALRFRDQRVEMARIVFGGVAPKPWRSVKAEQAIQGKALNSETISAAAAAAITDAEPLEQNGYKVLLLRGLVEETLSAL